MALAPCNERNISAFITNRMLLLPLPLPLPLLLLLLLLLPLLLPAPHGRPGLPLPPGLVPRVSIRGGSRGRSRGEARFRSGSHPPPPPGPGNRGRPERSAAVGAGGGGIGSHGGVILGHRVHRRVFGGARAVGVLPLLPGVGRKEGPRRRARHCR